MRLTIAALLALAIPAYAETYTVPAQPGAASALINSGKVVGGDVILLQDGDHGGLDIHPNSRFDLRVTIKAEHPHKAHVDFIYLRDTSQNITVAGLNVWPADPHVHGGQHIATWGGSAHITLSNLDIRGGQDAASYGTWSAAEWIARKATGIELGGSFNTVQNSKLTGVGFGIQLLGPNGKVIGNTITGFAADGLRGGSDHQVFRDNLVQDCFSVDDNHADGLQIYGGGRVITGVMIERNRIIEWNIGPNALRCGMQGIVAFDDFQEGITIRNNIVSVRNGHGIAVNGAHNAKIIYNTVVQADGLPGRWPWIALYNSNKGQQSSGVVIANNISMAPPPAADPANGIVVIGNGIITNPATAFTDLVTFTPTIESGFVGAADPSYKVNVDVRKHPRMDPDQGAVEAQ